jgi:lipopolysaccharide export system ATP-binding protein
MSGVKRLLALAAIPLLAVAPALSQQGAQPKAKGGSNAPVDVGADRIEVQDRANRAILSRPRAASRSRLDRQILRLAGLSPRRGSPNARDGAETDVSLAMGIVERAARCSGLLGPNGAGKTTCFYSIMGLVKPDSGRILLDGNDITGLPMYRRAILGLGYLPQETSIFRGLTVAQNIMAVLEVAEPDRKAREDRLEQLLAEFHIERLRDAPAMALSGGERRRCEIARALAANPSIMLLDEPFAGIDPISIQDIRDLIVALKKRDIGVLITDHNVRETLDIVDRACIIYDGQVLFAGSPEDLVADENVRRLYLGESFEL